MRFNIKLTKIIKINAKKIFIFSIFLIALTCNLEAFGASDKQGMLKKIQALPHYFIFTRKIASVKPGKESITFIEKEKSSFLSPPLIYLFYKENVKDKQSLINEKLSIAKSNIFSIEALLLFSENKQQIPQSVINAPIMQLDYDILRIGDFNLSPWGLPKKNVVLIQKEVKLNTGTHTVKEMNNPFCHIVVLQISPLNIEDLLSKNRGSHPEVESQRINNAKYIVSVKDAKEPFWLVFSESFHEGWRAYVTKSKIKYQISKIKEENFEEIVAEYPRLGVKEARHLQKFTPGDIRYSFRKADIEEHYLVNGYANGWYIEPDKLGLGKDFTLTLYFGPQSLTYLGLFISGLTLVGCIGYLIVTGISRKKNRKSFLRTSNLLNTRRQT